MSDVNSNSGLLKVSATSASLAVPISGAVVAIRLMTDGRYVMYRVTQTDSSGETELIEIPTPPPELSLTPSPSASPFAKCSVEVVADGYYTAANINIPIFPGITSVQNVALVPVNIGTELINKSGRTYVTDSSRPLK